MTIRACCVVGLALTISQRTSLGDESATLNRWAATLKRIESIEMTYLEEWEGKLPEAHDGGRSVSDCRLVFAYPSLRHEETRRLFDAGGMLAATRRRIIVYRDGKRIEVDFQTKRVSTTYRFDPQELNRLPIDAIGLRLVETQNTRLTDLLLHAAADTRLGTSVVDDKPTVVAELGPQMSEKIRPRNCTAEAAFKAWLRADFDGLPMSLEFDTGLDGPPHGDIRFAYKAKDFEPARDEGEGTDVQFPREMTCEDCGGAYTWRIENVVINPRLDGQTFKVSVPEGFSVSVEKPVRSSPR